MTMLENLKPVHPSIDNSTINTIDLDAFLSTQSALDQLRNNKSTASLELGKASNLKKKEKKRRKREEKNSNKPSHQSGYKKGPKEKGPNSATMTDDPSKAYNPEDHYTQNSWEWDY